MVKNILCRYGGYILLAVASACIGFWAGAGLYNNGGGNAGARQSLDAAIKSNQSQQQSAERITGSADAVAGGIEQAQSGISGAAAANAGAEQLVGECQSILAGIRARGKTYTATP